MKASPVEIQDFIRAVILVLTALAGYIAAKLRKQSKKIDKIDDAVNHDLPGEPKLNRKVKKMAEQIVRIETTQELNHKENRYVLKQMADNIAKIQVDVGVLKETSQ